MRNVLGILRWIQRGRLAARSGRPHPRSIGVGHGCPIALPNPTGIRVQRFTQELERSLHRFGAARQAGLEEWSPGGHR